MKIKNVKLGEIVTFEGEESVKLVALTESGARVQGTRSKHMYQISLETEVEKSEETEKVRRKQTVASIVDPLLSMEKPISEIIASVTRVFPERSSQPSRLVAYIKTRKRIYFDQRGKA